MTMALRKFAHLPANLFLGGTGFTAGTRLLFGKTASPLRPGRRCGRIYRQALIERAALRRGRNPIEQTPLGTSSLASRVGKRAILVEGETMARESKCAFLATVMDRILSPRRSFWCSRFWLMLCSLIVLPQPGYFAHPADTPESALLRGQGAFLRGAGSYNLNTARAASINADTVIRWKQDLRKIAAERRVLREQQELKKKQKIEDVKKRLEMREHELRVNPTSTDVIDGQALNALLYDLMDPDIPSSDWSSKPVQLPRGMSVKDLIFRFTPASASSHASKVLGRGVIALSRLDVKGENWPTVMKPAALDKERLAYESAYARLRDEMLADKFNLKTLQELDRSLDALKSKVQTAVPKERGFQEEAARYVEDLKDATRMFDAVTVDYSREILLDTKDQDATTVAELVGFMLKYRLQFSSAERSPTGRVLYGQIYEAMREQTNAFGIKPPEATAEDAKSPFQPKSAWVGDKSGLILTVVERNGETFRATLISPDGKIQRVITGTVKGNQVAWLAKDMRVIKGGSDHRHDTLGTISSGPKGDRIDIVWRDAKGGSGKGVYHRKSM